MFSHSVHPCCSARPGLERSSTIPLRFPDVVRKSLSIAPRRIPILSISEKNPRTNVRRYSSDQEDDLYVDPTSSSEPSYYASEHMEEDDLKAALKEALELFDSANKLSNLQVKAEMEQLFASEATPSSSQHEGGSGPPSSTPEMMLSFWVEQGLSQQAAARLMEELDAKGKTYTTNQCAAKVQRWQRVLPDCDIAGMAVKDSGLLEADINGALVNLVCLVEAFPGRDLVQLVARQPRLLWAENLRGRVQRVFDQLFTLHPSKDIAVVREIVFDNPELLYRMDYHTKATLIDELPIEIQNCMMGSHADQGIGFMVRYYNNRRTNYDAELLRNEFGPSNGSTFPLT